MPHLLHAPRTHSLVKNLRNLPLPYPVPPMLPLSCVGQHLPRLSRYLTIPIYSTPPSPSPQRQPSTPYPPTPLRCTHLKRPLPSQGTLLSGPIPCPPPPTPMRPHSVQSLWRPGLGPAAPALPLALTAWRPTRRQLSALPIPRALFHHETLHMQPPRRIPPLGLVSCCPPSHRSTSGGTQMILRLRISRVSTALSLVTRSSGKRSVSNMSWVCVAALRDRARGPTPTAA